MFKGQKTLAALAVSLLFTAPVYAADEGSGEIHFKVKLLKHRVKYIRMILIKRLNSVR
ncbi:hypothetical protein OkiPb00131_31080 [Escherichia coli]|nr:fimbrial-like adhesin protein [Escherichia coli]GDO42684.1 fimbrial-like adhesin protein [Escherichia coli]